jgi:hypothetical protein
MAVGHHLSLSLSRDLWSQILQTALPFPVGSGELSLAGAAREVVRQLGVRQRVAGLLDDARAPQPLVHMSKLAAAAWDRRRAGVFSALDGLVRVEGTWRVEVDEVGTDLVYGPQKVTADAWLRGVAEGNITFLQENLTLPFRIEKRVGASVAVGRIRFARDRDAVIGNLQDLAVHLGDHRLLQLMSRALEYGLSLQVQSMEALPILKREQVEGMVGGLGGGLRMNMGVDDLQLDINEDDLTLKVRFGFSRAPEQAQLGVDRP